MRNGTDSSRRSVAQVALATCMLILSILTLPHSALADPPSHGRAPSLDVEGLNHACGVAVDSKGDLYASSAGEGKVKVYNPAHAELTSISNTNEPCGLAVDSKGKLYVSEKATGNVVRYTPNAYPFSGTPTYGSAEPIDSSGNAEGIAVDRADDRLYVAEGTHVAIYKSDTSFEANVGGGDLTNATGVAAYTYIFTGSLPSNLKRHYYLTVADAATDQVKVFSAKEGSALKLRRTISAVDHDEDPETTDQSFGFGAQGAYLAADPGNESRETRKCIQVQVEGNNQACTQGHFFLYDDANDAVDEFDATGEFVDQIVNGAFADAEPTALAVERSGAAGDGTLYVSAGAAAGAKLLAFAPLGLPARDPLPGLSRALANARTVAIDCEGYVYVGTTTEVRVYDPEGNEVTNFEDAEAPIDLAADCEGNVYVVDGPTSAERKLTYYSPSSYPPTGSTEYNREPELIPGEFEGNSLQAVAINPANEHAFVLGGSAFTPVIAEFGSADEESPVIGECGAGLGLTGTRLDIDVYRGTGEGAAIYVTGSSQNLAKVSCDEPEELLNVQIKGGGCPNGELGQNPRVAIDQSNGHIIEYANNQAGGAREYDSSGACVAEFGTFSSGPASYRIAVDSSCALHDPPLTEQTTPTCASLYPGNGNVYVASDGSNNEVQPFDVVAFGSLEHACLGVCNPTEFELTVKKTGTGTGKVTGPGIDCGSDCSELYEEGTKVTLEAKEDGGSTFAGWSGSGCSGTGKCEVTMSAAKEVTAEFSTAAKPKFALKVKKAGSGTGMVTSSPAGINCGLDCEEEYEEGTPVTLTGTAGANTKAVVWSGCDSVNGENECLVTMSAAKEVTATFALEQHLLSVSKAGSGTGKVTSSPPGIDCGATCSASFDHGTVVTLEADADAGSEFTGWSGACSGTGTCEVTMSAARAVTAGFDEETTTTEFALTVETEGTGTGTVTSDKGAISCDPFCTDDYEEGTVVVLTATPNPGSVFVSWKYCDKGGVNGRQCTMTVDKAKTVKATFTTTHTLEVSRAGSGLGKVQSSPGGILCLSNCAETTAAFKEGTKVTLKQTPAKHFHFVEWLGDCTGSASCEPVMGEDHEVEAKFAEDPKHLLTLTKSGGGQGTVKSSVAGINCGATCSEMSSAYYQGEVVELTVTPGKGSAFGGWSGACSGTGACTVTMSEAREVVAEFE
ncbi:MAG TPA: hypothetical protein VIS51_03275 [Solirubrobacterales bacterium]